LPFIVVHGIVYFGALEILNVNQLVFLRNCYKTWFLCWQYI